MVAHTVARTFSGRGRHPKLEDFLLRFEPVEEPESELAENWEVIRQRLKRQFTKGRKRAAAQAKERRLGDGNHR